MAGIAALLKVVNNAEGPVSIHLRELKGCPAVVGPAVKSSPVQIAARLVLQQRGIWITTMRKREAVEHGFTPTTTGGSKAVDRAVSGVSTAGGRAVKNARHAVDDRPGIGICAARPAEVEQRLVTPGPILLLQTENRARTVEAISCTVERS